MVIKTRFAPSPTGFLHIGSVRTALYSWLFARQHKGKFLLRIEDTDLKRLNKSSVIQIMDTLKWLGLNWDEGPYFQSNNIKHYKTIISNMINSGQAYKCYCSIERLKKLRKTQILLGQKPKYDQKCRNIKVDSHNLNYVVRFRNPNKGVISFFDKVRGDISVNNKELDDLIIQRDNGIPTYNFCSVIDDRDMNITHVIRGEDHINNTFRQINILKSLNSNIPQYAHVSMILNEDRKKLSKRTQVTTVSEYKLKGFLPHAVLNYVLRLGWSYGNQEIFNVIDMIKLFSLNSINKAPSCLNYKKLLWLNRFYIRTLPEDVIVKYLKNQFEQNNINYNSNKYLNLIELIKLVGSRCNTLQDIIDNSRYFYEEHVVLNKLIIEQNLTKISKMILNDVYAKFLDVNIWNRENLKFIIHELINKFKVSFNDIAMPIRIAITGNTISPSIDTTLYKVGKRRSLLRIKFLLSYINKKLNCSLFRG